MVRLTELFLAILGVASALRHERRAGEGASARKAGVADCPIPPGFRVLNLSGTEVPMAMAVASDLRKDVISKFLVRQGYWEIKHPRELGALAGVEIPANGTLLDVGANFGYYAILFAKIGYNAIAVEPMKLNREVIEANLCLNPDVRDRVHVAPVALVSPEERGSRCVLYSPKANRGDGVLNCSLGDGALPCTPTDGSVDGACESVQVSTLDELLEEQGIQSVDVVKMDVEGFECKILRGGRSLFDKFHVKLLQAETKQKLVAKCFAKEAEAHGYRVGDGIGHDENRVMSSLKRRLGRLAARLAPHSHWTYMAQSRS